MSFASVHGDTCQDGMTVRQYPAQAFSETSHEGGIQDWKNESYILLVELG